MKRTRTHLLTIAAILMVAAAASYQLSSTSEPEPASTSPAGKSPPGSEALSRTTSQPSPSEREQGEPDPKPDEEKSSSPETRSTQFWAQTAQEDEDLPSDPAALAIGALDFPDMKGLDPEDPSYDPEIEAQQAFAPMEQDLLDADPLDEKAWKEALERHKIRNLSVSKRAAFLRKSGHPDLAEDLLIEWGRVYGSWQARAYGRSGPPGYKP